MNRMFSTIGDARAFEYEKYIACVYIIIVTRLFYHPKRDTNTYEISHIQNQQPITSEVQLISISSDRRRTMYKKCNYLSSSTRTHNNQCLMLSVLLTEEEGIFKKTIMSYH